VTEKDLRKEGAKMGHDFMAKIHEACIHATAFSSTESSFAFLLATRPEKNPMKMNDSLKWKILSFTLGPIVTKSMTPSVDNKRL